MYELVKTLAEEPAKRKKVLIFYIRVVLSSVAATKLYIHYLGDFTLLNPYIKEFFPLAFDFFISGKVIVVGFLYVLCHFLLFEVLSMIPPLVLNYFTQGKLNKIQLDGGIIAGHLLLCGVIKRNKENREVSVGKNFDEYYYELLEYEESTTRDEVHSYKTSLLFEILTTYFIGIIVFYYFTTIDLPIVLDWIFIIGFIFLVLFYINICWLINLFERNSSELITLLHTLKVEKIVNSSLKQFDVPFSDNKKNPGVFFSKTVTVNNINKLLFYYGTNLDLGSRYIKDAIQGANQIKIPEVILLTNTSPTEKTEKLIQENQEHLTVVKFKTEDDLKIQLMKYLYDQ